MKKIKMKKHKQLVIKSELKAKIIGISVFLFYLFLFALAFSFGGCVKYVDKEVLVPYEVSVPVPMKCKFDLTMPPRVDTSNLQSLLDSSTATLKYNAELYQAIKKVPCLDFKE